jgi:hypothetical protein
MNLGRAGACLGSWEEDAPELLKIGANSAQTRHALSENLPDSLSEVLPSRLPSAVPLAKSAATFPTFHASDGSRTRENPEDFE